MKKRALQETNWTAFLLLLVALFLIINYLSYRHYHRWDVTAWKTYSLSPQTVKTLKGLKQPLKVVVFLARNDDLYDKVKDLLTAYSDASSKVQVEYIDPDRDKARLQVLAQRYNVTLANVVVFDAGTSSKYVERDQMVEYDFSAVQYGAPPKMKGFKAEEAFTNAILDVLNPKKAVVYFTQGHGERSGGEQGEGLDTFRDRLAKEGDQLRDWESLGKSSVPEDADLLVVAGPKKPFLPQEADAVARYLEKGGRVLFMMDPITLEGKPPTFGETGLEGVLRFWGVTLGQDIAADPAAAVPQVGAQTFFALNYSEHPIVKDLKQNKYPVLFSLAQSLGEGAASDKAYLAQSLLRSSSAAWGEKDLAGIEKGISKEPTDTQGPLNLAAAVSSEAPGKKTRIVVVGDSDLITDELLQVGVGNLLFCLNAAHWLLQEESRIAIPPKTAIEAHLTLTSTQSNVLFVLFVLVFPAAVIAAGVFVYLRRRR
jgi:ABC-type uncharacterized transport system involved in gliding motility auxiliary subunit